MNRFNRKKFWIKLTTWVIVCPLLLFAALTGILYWKQQPVVQGLITTLNEDFKGHIELKGSHISPFANFPYISIDLEDLKVYEDKTRQGAAIIDIHDVYIGFDIWTLLSGDVEIKSLKLRNGALNIVQHADGELNIAKALTTEKEIDDAGKEFHIDLKSIELDHVDINKFNEENDVWLDVFVTHAKSKFKTGPDHIMVAIDSKFELTVVKHGDTTFVKHKHLDLNTHLDYVESEQKLMINPSEILLEGASFSAVGSIDFDDDMTLDLSFQGAKPNFDLLIAFAPEELIPTLRKYENKGKVYFNAVVQGKSIHGHNPFIDVNFGCEEAFLSNAVTRKRLDDLQFKGHFTNGEQRSPATMELSLIDFSARPETGVFNGNLYVRNFESPEIDLQLVSDFELDFLAKFFEVTNLENLTGSVKLTMNFKDIIDLENPEKSIERLNESYYTELRIQDLGFYSPAFHLPLNDLDLYITMDGHAAKIEHCNLKVGNSDISIKGNINDLPAVLHHTNIDVLAHLDITSAYLDLYELTNNGKENNKPVDEQISNLSLGLSFKTSAKAMTESPSLPMGEFFIDNLYAKLKHYPHTFHDFHADLMIEERDFRIIDFRGMIDKSDFHFNGRLKNYDLWFEEDPAGDTKIEFLLNSELLQLEDLFSYGGENYVPEDYRHEEFRNLNVHGYADLHFLRGLKSTDIYLDRIDASLKIHPMRFEKFRGRIHIEDEHLMLENFSGKIGRSSFTADLNYYFGDDKMVKKRDNKLYLKAAHLDFDELFSYNAPSTVMTPEEHEKGFNIYELPFTDMQFRFDIGHLNYHRYLMDDFKAIFRTQENHYIYIDSLSVKAAGGTVSLSGYFNGSDSHKIYFSPDMQFKNVDLDKLLFKFENFGQDHLVSENLHGKLTGRLTGKIHMHADMVPIIDDSEVHIDFSVVEGRLENYGPMDALSDYFKDKNLSRIRFDTLANKVDLKDGTLNIPKMTIASSLGFIELSGKQHLNLDMEYYLRIPFKLVTQAAASKLFGKTREEIDTERDDEIITQNDSKKTKYVNLKLTGNPDNYKVSLGRDKGK